MRPTLHVLSQAMIARVLAEAKQILAEIGIEVRGPALKERLREHGLPVDASGERLLFPPAVV
jgi:trimethylamine--corrinoid protein Co-methyltransferase